MATKPNVKNESLLENTIESVQCFKCKAVPGLATEKQNRYSCVNESHQLCEKCKTVCACGSAVGKRPNPTTKHILKNLPAFCPHYNTGCRQIFVQPEGLDDHQQGCIFRQVFCPRYDCNEKVMFKNVIDHLKQVHKSKKYGVAIENKYTCMLGTSVLIENEAAWNEAFLFQQGIKIGSDVDFFLVGKIIHKIAHFWLYVMASPLEAKRYAYTLSVTGKDGNKFIAFNDYAKPLDEGQDEIIENQLVFMIGTEAIKKIRNENQKLAVEVTIRDLKEGAKDVKEESGVEDESD